MKKAILGSIVLITSLIISTFSFAAPAQSGALNPAQVKQVKQVIHDYLLQNPKLMVEVFRKLQEQQRAKMEKRAITAIHANYKQIFNDRMSPRIGAANGPVTVVEFFDYQCPHCKTMATTLENFMKGNRNVQVVFKEFPIFPGSQYAAMAALASAKQGKYYEFHNALMADKNPLTKNDVLATAKKLGINVAQLEKDMQSKDVKQELQNTIKLAQSIGIAGTPAFIVQNNKVKAKTFFVPGQVSGLILQQLVSKAK